MKKLVHVIDNAGHLRDNIIELLEMEGYQVDIINPDDVNEELREISGVVLLNGFSLKNQAEQIISTVKERSNGFGSRVLVLSEDHDWNAFQKADQLIPYPFSNREFSESVANYSN